MSNVKYYDFNLVDQAATTITASTQEAFYPASNIKDARGTKVWRSTSTADNIVFDFVTTENVDSILIRGATLDATAFNTTVTIEANPTNVWTSPAFSTTLTFNQTWNLGVKSLPSAQTYRFWRLSFTGSSFIEVANVFIGEATQITTNNIDFGWKHQRVDNTKIVKNRYGQLFTDILNKQLKINAKYRLLDQTEFVTLSDMFENVDTYKPLWIVVDENEDIVDAKERFAGMFFLDKMPQFVNNSPFLYDMSFSVTEAP